MKDSIAIPVYSAAPHLDECVRPALGQTRPDKVIAVDDGSTDR